MSSTRTPIRVGLFGAAALLVGAAIYWLSRPAPASPALAATTAEQLTTANEDRHVTRNGARPGGMAAATPGPESPAGATATADTEVATVAQYTAEKYQFLLDDLRHLPADRLEQLRQALLKRELLAGASPRPEPALAQAEGEIRGLLRPADYVTYEALRESDLEQFQLNDYAGGISNVAPLSVEDRRSILKTKLAYKQRFRQLVQDSGLERGGLSATEREYAYSVTSRAMQDYKSSYLQEVRQYLTNDEQFALLSNYETTEFEAELAKLRTQADGG
jgi:hypothetical protein